MNCLSSSDATGSQGQRCTADGCCSLSCCKSDCTCLDLCDLMRQTSAQRHHGALGGAKTLDCAAPSGHGPPRATSDAALSHTHCCYVKEKARGGVSQRRENEDMIFISIICRETTENWIWFVPTRQHGMLPRSCCAALKRRPSASASFKFILVTSKSSPLHWCVHTQRSVGSAGKRKGFV